jgi:hypothetical protein
MLIGCRRSIVFNNTPSTCDLTINLQDIIQKYGCFRHLTYNLVNFVSMRTKNESKEYDNNKSAINNTQITMFNKDCIFNTDIFTVKCQTTNLQFSFYVVQE